MKENNKLVVFYEVEECGFLKSYKDRGNLAFGAVFTDDLRDALYLPLESYEAQKADVDKLAEAFGCEVLIVEVEYNVTKLDGSDFERTVHEEVAKDEIKALLKSLFD